MSGTVVIGAGIAGVRTALELRRQGYDDEIVLIGDETEHPYDRPPLSKEFLKGSIERETLGLLSADVARDQSITLRLGTRVERIHPAERRIDLADGTSLEYQNLVLATGASNRSLPVAGADLKGVWSLRSIDDAHGLRQALDRAANVVIVGGGFIGLEVAAAARARGANVTVVEFLPRVMARVLSSEMSEYFALVHIRHGVTLRTGVGVTAVLPNSDGSVSAVALSDGAQVPADLVVVGVGVRPATDLAEDAGLEVSDGIVVDGFLRTSDPHIYAVGDCARFDCVVSGRGLRLESIQNAGDQARFLAAYLASSSDNSASVAPGYKALPWFWTEQFDAKLQIAGVATPEAASVVRGDPTSGKFSVGRFLDGQLIAVESVNQASDHLGARKLLTGTSAQRTRATIDNFADPSVPLKSLFDG